MMARPARASSVDLLDLHLADLLLGPLPTRTARRVPRMLIAATVLLAAPAATLLAVQLISRPGNRASPFRTNEAAISTQHAAGMRSGPRFAAGSPVPEQIKGIAPVALVRGRHTFAKPEQAHRRTADNPDDRERPSGASPPLLSASPVLRSASIIAAGAGPTTIAAAAALPVGSTAQRTVQREERQDAIDAIRALRSQ